MPQPFVEDLIQRGGLPDLMDDVDRKKREEIISFIEAAITAVSAQQNNPHIFVEFDQLLEQAIVWGYDREDEFFKFDLEEALNYLIISKILTYEEVEIDDEKGNTGIYRFYYILVSQYLN